MALKYNQYVGFIDKSGYLVKPIAALKQKAAEASNPAPRNNDPVILTPPSVGGDGPVAPGVENPGFVPETPAKPQHCHFEMVTTLDSTRVVKNIGNLMDEVINHLMQVDGAKVEIKLLVEATNARWYTAYDCSYSNGELQNLEGRELWF